GGTVLLATPTFLRTYLRRCEKEDFESLDAVIVGAERLPPELSDAFEERFGIRPVEGYGTTELSPLVSANIPPSRSWGESRIEVREGTVGRPVPGVSARITDMETGEELGVGCSGMLWIKGPNVMKGYYGNEVQTAGVMQDGWYRTGDVAMIDEDGFIQITGRESRFSKIGGEMVPHIRIEEALARIIGADEEDGPKAAVTSVLDARKGERLVVVHTALEKTPEQLCAALAQAGLPNICIPSQDSFCQVDELPILGTGKLDLKGIKKIATDRFGGGI
ncbi:MAG: AMP-binding protein, partial [Planctomycetes bacterium]|nr:AMP-binding protein [Planctomycetota bacterium]